MLGNLIPRQKLFFDLFERGADRTVEGTKLLGEMLNNPEDLREWARKIKNVEHEADLVTHETIERMHKTFVTPLDREDIHRLITRMDDILDGVESAAERIWLYELTAITEVAKQLAHVLAQASVEVRNAVGGLRNLKDPKSILHHCIEINRLENEGDQLLREGLARLFREEEDLRLVLKWKEIYETLEHAIDRTEDVANIIEGVVLEHV